MYKLTFKGEDKFGAWTGLGYYINGDNGVSFWLKKQYHDIKKAKHFRRWRNLIYEGNLNDSGNYNGRWYFVGFEKDSKYSGTFKMIFFN